MDSLKNNPNNDREGSEAEFWPLSEKPNFNMIVKKTQLKPQYMLVNLEILVFSVLCMKYQFLMLKQSVVKCQYVPAKLSDSLPLHDVPVILTYGGKKWETRCFVYRRQGISWRTSIKWREFAMDNNVKEGDACVFELTKTNYKLIKLKVQILRGDFPAQLLPRADGQSADNPIVI